MSGTLYVVATPIGNLEDITLRALRVLREVSVIAAEDTRRTSKLLAAHAISTKTVSFHEHNTRARMPQLIGRLERGEDVAVVSDAGTPCVSDPGIELVQACVGLGIDVDPLPGASAPLTALIGSGFPLIPFTFYGFAPNRSRDRSNWFSELSKTLHTFSFFESPHRIGALLDDCITSFGIRPICIARELTKMHAEFIRGTAHELAHHHIPARGEFTVVVGPSDIVLGKDSAAPADEDIAASFWRMSELNATSRRDAVRRVSVLYGISPNDVYLAVERTKSLAKQPTSAS